MDVLLLWNLSMKQPGLSTTKIVLILLQNGLRTCFFPFIFANSAQFQIGCTKIQITMT